MRNYLSSRFPALASRDFSIFLSVQFASNIGTQMQLVAINWQIYELTGSALALGLIGLFRFLPLLFFSLIGGSFADAHNRKKILYVTQTGLITLSVLLAYLTYAGTVRAEAIYIITALAALVLSFEAPARQALIPNLLPRKNLTNGLSIASIMYQSAMIVGPTLSGLLIAHWELWGIYSLNSLSYIFVIVGLLFISTTGEVVGEKVQVSIKTIVEGLMFVRSRTIIWSTMLLDFFSTFFASATTLLPIFAKDILAVGPERLGLLYAAPAIGAVGAGLFMAHKHQLGSQGKVLLASVSFYALGTIIFGLSQFYALSVAALILVGAGDSISAIIRNSIRQLETPDYIRGRMSSINMIFFMGGPQAGEFEAGVVANYLGARFSVVTGGIITLFIVGFMAFKVPKLRNYDKHEDLLEAISPKK